MRGSDADFRQAQINYDNFSDDARERRELEDEQAEGLEILAKRQETLYGEGNFPKI